VTSFHKFKSEIDLSKLQFNRNASRILAEPD